MFRSMSPQIKKVFKVVALRIILWSQDVGLVLWTPSLSSLLTLELVVFPVAPIRQAGAMTENITHLVLSELINQAYS